MAFQDVPNNQRDALLAGYWSEAHSLPVTPQQIVYRGRLGIWDDKTTEVKKVEWQVRPHIDRNDPTYRRSFNSFRDFVGFCKSMSASLKIISIN